MYIYQFLNGIAVKYSFIESKGKSSQSGVSHPPGWHIHEASIHLFIRLTSGHMRSSAYPLIIFSILTWRHFNEIWVIIRFGQKTIVLHEKIMAISLDRIIFCYESQSILCICDQVTMFIFSVDLKFTAFAFVYNSILLREYDVTPLYIRAENKP